VVRLQAHGVTERELARAKLQHLSDMESAFIEKDQTYSDGLRGEYVEHFLRGEPAPGIEYEARLAKTLIPRESPYRLHRLHVCLWPTHLWCTWGVPATPWRDHHPG